MVTVTGFTAERAQEIEDEAIVDGHVDGAGHLILTKNNAIEIDAGSVVGPQGDVGPAGGSEDKPISSRLAMHGRLATGGIRQYNNPGPAIATLYTVPAGKVAFINRLRASNLAGLGSGAFTVRVAVNPTGGNTLAVDKALVYDASISQGESYDLLEDAVLQAGATITTYASNANVAFHLDGVEFNAVDLTETPKVLGQVLPASAATTVLYTVPAGKKAVISHLHVVNVVGGGALAYFRVQDPNFRIFDAAIGRYEHHRLMEGAVLPTGTVVSVRSDTASAIGFHLFGSEI